MKQLPKHVIAKGFTNWKDYMAWLRSKRTKKIKPSSEIERYFSGRSTGPSWIIKNPMKKIWEEIKKQFPGKNNRALRDQIFKLAQNTGQVIGLKRTIALTAQGKTALYNVQKIIDSHQNPRRRNKRKKLPALVTSKARFIHQRLRSSRGLHHMRTIKVGDHRVIIGCPVRVHKGKCPVGTIAQAILHPDGRITRRKHLTLAGPGSLGLPKNPIAVYNPPGKLLPMTNIIIRYRRASGEEKGGHFEHKFGHEVRVYGLSDGSILLKGKKLWGPAPR